MALGAYTLVRLASPQVLPTLQAQKVPLFWTLRGVDLGELGWVGVVGELGPAESVSNQLGGVPVITCSVITSAESLLLVCAIDGAERRSVYFDPDTAELARTSGGFDGAPAFPHFNAASWAVKHEPLPFEARHELARWTSKADFVVDDWEFVALAMLGHDGAPAPKRRATQPKKEGAGRSAGKASPRAKSASRKVAGRRR